METRTCRSCGEEFDKEELRCPACGKHHRNRLATAGVIVSILLIILMIALFEPWVWILAAILIPAVLFVIVSYFE